MFLINVIKTPLKKEKKMNFLAAKKIYIII